jgi:hypothetical protein
MRRPTRRPTYGQMAKFYNARAKQYKINCETIKENIDKIKNHDDTVIIKYPQHKEAFDYVDNLYPKEDVKSVVVYHCNQKFLSRLGYKGVGGFFEKVMKTVVLSSLDHGSSKKYSITAKIEIDEVLVHELLHYVCDCEGVRKSSVEVEEEFAYGNSIGYLRSKGMSDEDIVNNNFLPFFVSIADNKKVIKKILLQNEYDLKEFSTYSIKRQNKILGRFKKTIFEEIKQTSFDKAMELIAIYSDSDDEVVCEEKSHKFLDLF